MAALTIPARLLSISPLLAALCLLVGISIAFPVERDDDTPGGKVTQSDTIALDPADLFIHPLCLDRGEEVRRGAGFWCDPALASVKVTARQGAGVWKWADRPRGEEDWSLGSIGFRVADRWHGERDDLELAVLEISDHGGGSGRFGRIEVFERRDDDRYRVLHRIDAGDRCNDGFVQYVSIDDDAIVYRTAATAFRLLNPIDDTNWRMINLMNNIADSASRELDTPETLLGWQPYSDIAHCAICCQGAVVHRRDLNGGAGDIVGVMIGEAAFIDRSRDDTINGCLHAWSGEQDWSDRQMIGIDEWNGELARLSLMCQQP